MLDRTLPGVQQLKHLVVLMMENRSFDHMLGALQATNPNIDGLTGNESNPDEMGNAATVAPNAEYQSQLDPDPDHHFPAVDLQIFGGVTTAQDPNRKANMQGFVKSYYNQQHNLNHSHLIMSYFTPDKLPVLTTLAKNFAVFNRWFSSIPGPTLCNRAFAHYGTSFGQVAMDIFYWNKQYKSIYERLQAAGRTTRLYYFDQASSSLEVVNLLQHQPELFGSFQDFLSDCAKNKLPEYCFIEPNYTDHDSPDGQGECIACDQHPDHDVRAGEQYIATVYKAIRGNPKLWPNTALLIVYDEHGGIYDHVPPPACTPDGFVAQPKDTGTPDAFRFDRLGVRVPGILVSPWVQKGSVINEMFEHACIPATATEFFLGSYDQRSPREKAASTFLGNLSLSAMRADDDCPMFQDED
ncbi:MAG TPA: alkaline phosphatase family protein [Terracidiphilus sp.]|nr:alkaline phosphatase family protein [Terracidiphilus sp.]